MTTTGYAGGCVHLSVLFMPHGCSTPTNAPRRARFPHPTMPPWQRTTQPSLVLSLCAPRYCHTASAGFGRQFTKLRALSRLRRRYGSKKVPSPLNFSAASAAAQRRRPGSSRWGWRPKCRPRPRQLRADRPAPRACPGRSPSAPPTCPAAE